MQKIVILWHAAVKKEYQNLIESLALVSKYQYTLITPKTWPEGTKKPIKAESFPNNHFLHLKLPILFSGISKHYYPTLSFYLKKLKPNLIDVIEEANALVTYQVYLYAKKNKIPYLFNSAENTSKKQTFFLKWIEKKIFNTSKGAIFRNTITASLLEKRGFEKKSVCIGNGIDNKCFLKKNQILLRKQFQFSTKQKIIGFVGRLVEEKGILLLIDVFKKLSLKIDELHLMIIGDGNLLNLIKKKLSKEIMDKKITLSKQVPHKKLVDFYNLMDILVVPSLIKSWWQEPFGRIIIEAMACECLVLGSSSGHIPKLIQEKKMLFKAGNALDLQKKILTILNHQNQYLTLKKKNRLLVKEYFWKNLAKKRIHFYKNFLKV